MGVLFPCQNAARERAVVPSHHARQVAFPSRPPTKRLKSLVVLVGKIPNAPNVLLIIVGLIVNDLNDFVDFRLIQITLIARLRKQK